MDKSLELKLIGNCKFILLSDICFYFNDEKIIIKSGFITDLASVPRLFWGTLPPHGDYAKAAVIHDYLLHLDDSKKGRLFADTAFLFALKELGINKQKRLLMYYAVRFKSFYSNISFAPFRP